MKKKVYTKKKGIKGSEIQGPEGELRPDFDIMTALKFHMQSAASANPINWVNDWKNWAKGLNTPAASNTITEKLDKLVLKLRIE